MQHLTVCAILALSLFTRCPLSSAQQMSTTFGEDLAFLQAHTAVVVLSDAAGMAKIIVSPAMQGRVLTSTASGDAGMSYGWINRDLIASGERQEHINVFGGEDRFWLGPEGGQFSIYFKEGDPFNLAHWHVPAAIDWDPFDVVAEAQDRIVFSRAMQLTNYSGTVFDFHVDREVRLLSREEALGYVGLDVQASVSVVGYESVNTITNTGQEAWTRESGMLSVWILGMYNPSPMTTVVIPFVPGSEEALGPIVNDQYFGAVPSDRLVVADSVLFFKGDGAYRSKIGLSYRRSRSALGSFDAAGRVLTVVQYNRPDREAGYVNAMWELQEHPFAGDVINSYNDGAPAPGAEPLGPFYELETSSPAAALLPGAALTHIHRTIHLQGDAVALNSAAVANLGVGLENVRNAFSQ